MSDKILMEHGSGGRSTSALIDEIFTSQFHNVLEDAAAVKGSGTLAITTDSFVVTPVEFPGGDIGRLCVCGTVNDMLMRGAKPMYLTCGFILKEGTSIDLLKRVVQSMSDTAKEAGVTVVAGDTKVIEGEGEGGILINTTGVGFIPDGLDISATRATEGDVIIASGFMGDHHAAILSSRLSIENNIESDNAPLGEMVLSMIEEGVEVHTLRDVTRGGLATVLKELAVTSNLVFEVDETEVPVNPSVKDFCGLLGLDPMYMGNEGKLIAVVAEKDANKALKIIKSSKYGENAAIIGRVVAPDEKNSAQTLVMNTKIGGRRILDVLVGEGLPRIC